VHKPTAVIAVLALVVAMAGCGSNNGSNTNVNGNWSATLLNSSDGSSAFSFTTTLNEASQGNVTVTNFKFTSTGSCFVDGQTTQSGNFTLSGDFSGNVKGTFGMTVSSLPSSGTQSQLVLQGGVGPNNTVTGTWTLSGSSACTGNGTFVFNRM